MHVWDATPKTHTFWHCAFQTRPYKASKNGVGGLFGAEVCAFGASRQKYILFGHRALQTQPYVCVVGAPAQKYTLLALCISNTPILGI